MDVLYKIIGDKEAIMLVEMRDKAIIDEQTRLNGARKEGVEEGKIEVLEETMLDNLS